MLKIEINVENSKWKKDIPGFKENIEQAVKQTFKNSTLEVIVQSIIQVFKKSSQYKNLCINVNKVDN